MVTLTDAETKPFVKGDIVRLKQPSQYTGLTYAVASAQMTVMSYGGLIGGVSTLRLWNPVMRDVMEWRDRSDPLGRAAFDLVSPATEAKQLVREEDDKSTLAGIDMHRKTPMGREEAVALRTRIINETDIPKECVRVRSRTWDFEAKMFAIDIYDRDPQSSIVDIEPKQKLYFPNDVRELLAKHVPEKLVGETYPGSFGTKYTFVTGQSSGGYVPMKNFLLTPGGSNVWSKSDIESVGGIARDSVTGKRYLLGMNIFVPFVDNKATK